VDRERDLINGTVVRVDSKANTVDTPLGALRCVIRGRLAEARAKNEQLLVVGDEVRVEALGKERGAIEEVLPRRSKLSRRSAGSQPLEQVVAANVDQLVIVTSLAEPPLNLNLVDRYLVAADSGELSAAICVNKIDLGDRRPIAPLLATYEALGYPVLWTSATEHYGIDRLRACLSGRTSVVAGKSGVGKSALLNAVEPGLELHSAAISAATGKGRHTTSFSSLLPLSGGGYVIDTPGIRKYTLWEIDPQELDRHFPEIAELRGGCRFANCSHSHEPDCAVKDAVAAGKIDRRRHLSYLRILEGLDEE
jgi:ribosome biogenesis GTPase